MAEPVSIQEDFDALLGGGLQPRCITHVYGAPGSGKTNMVLMAVANAARKGKVVYVDSEGGFSVDRLRQIAGEDYLDILRNVMLLEPTDFDEQKLAISKLSDLVPELNPSLVVVDSLAVLYRLEEDRDVKELARQLAKLLRVARKHNLSVLVTNQIYTDIDTREIVPIGGDVMRYWAKVSLELERPDDKTNLRIAVLKKHKFLPEGRRMAYRITDKGIQALKMPSSGYGTRA